MRLVDFAKDHLIVVPVDVVGDLIAAGAIRVDGHTGDINELIAPDAVVRVDDAATAAIAAIAISPENVPLTIVHEDDEVVIVDKPAGMHVHPLGAHRTGTLLNGLLWHAGARPDQPWGRWRPRPLHRLDRAASGLMAIGKTTAPHVLERRYRAMVRGAISGDSGTIDAPLGRDPALDYRRAVVAGGQRAVTRWRVVERWADRTLVELELETGRTHQIRAHLASIGHPIIDDVLYASGGAPSVAISLCAHELRVDGRLYCSPGMGEQRSGSGE